MLSVARGVGVRPDQIWPDYWGVAREPRYSDTPARAARLVRFARGARGMSVRDLAEKANRSDETIFALESGRTRLRSAGTDKWLGKTYVAICLALGVPEPVARECWPDHPYYVTQERLVAVHELVGDMWTEFVDQAGAPN